MAAITSALALAVAGCTSDACDRGPDESRPVARAATLGDASDITASVGVDPISGVTLSLRGNATDGECSTLSASATLNEEPMQRQDRQEVDEIPGACTVECCENPSYSCGSLDFTSPPSSATTLDFVVSDTSGSREIVVLVSGTSPTFAIHGSNVLVQRKTVAIDVSPPNAVATDVFATGTQGGTIFDTQDLTSTSSGFSFVVPNLSTFGQSSTDAGADLGACGDPALGPIAFPCSATLEVSFSSPSVTATTTICGFADCEAMPLGNLTSVPVVLAIDDGLLDAGSDASAADAAPESD